MHAYSFSFVVTAPTRKAKKRRGEPSAKLQAHLKIQEEEKKAKKASEDKKSEDKQTKEENKQTGEDGKPKEIIVTAIKIIRRF